MDPASVADELAYEVRHPVASARRAQVFAGAFAEAHDGSQRAVVVRIFVGVVRQALQVTELGVELDLEASFPSAPRGRTEGKECTGQQITAL